jgi:glycerol-3-phosphate acyltransferase PlsY
MKGLSLSIAKVKQAATMGQLDCINPSTTITMLLSVLFCACILGMHSDSTYIKILITATIETQVIKNLISIQIRVAFSLSIFIFITKMSSS